MGEIVIEETNYKAFAMAMANLFLLLAAIAVTIVGIIEHKPIYKLSGIAGSLALLAAFIRAVVKALDVKRLLTITRDGIIDNSSIGGVGFISFDDIKEFQIVTLYNKHVIAVIPQNIDVFLSKLPVVKRRQAKRNVRLDLPPVTITVNMAKDMEPEDILSLLQKRLSDYSSLYD
jgi:hypothetical protein